MTAISFLTRRPIAAVQLLLVLALMVVTIFGRQIAPYDPFALDVVHRFQGPSIAHLFGTDELGRDIFSRVLAGAAVSVPVAVAVPLTAAIVGLIVGTMSGYLGGWVDEGIMRTVDLFLAFPPVILAMAIVAALGADVFTAAVAMTVVYIPFYARLVRVETIREMQKDYVTAAIAMGASPYRLIARHLTPNILPVVIVKLSLDVGQTILTFSFLSFIGIGAQPPTPEWGLMVAQGRRFLIDYWWYPTFPGIAILVTGTFFTLLGDTLNGLLRPENRRGSTSARRNPA